VLLCQNQAPFFRLPASNPCNKTDDQYPEHPGLLCPANVKREPSDFQPHQDNMHHNHYPQKRTKRTARDPDSIQSALTPRFHDQVQVPRHQEKNRKHEQDSRNQEDRFAHVEDKSKEKYLNDAQDDDAQKGDVSQAEGDRVDEGVTAASDRGQTSPVVGDLAEVVALIVRRKTRIAGGGSSGHVDSWRKVRGGYWPE
jgi:hypothetical protein